LSPGFLLASVPEREDARDAFLSVRYSHLEKLPKNARLGTSSLRRQAQLHSLRANLEIIPLRGNVDTRLRKLHSGEFDAIILAAAGVTRLGLTQMVRHHFEPTEICPAAGQGALAIGQQNPRHSLRERGFRTSATVVSCFLRMAMAKKKPVDPQAHRVAELVTSGPLAGKLIVVTRAHRQADDLCSLLKQFGAEVI